jgi:hypothetical protein
VLDLEEETSVLKILGTILVAALAVTGQPAAKPDFSGEWKMNAAKSNFGAIAAPEFITRSITHAEPSLTIVEEQRPAMGDEKVTRQYVTDGSPTTFQSGGATVKTSAVWKEKTLQVNSSVDEIGLTFVDHMSLSDDGKTLTSAVTISSPQGDVDLTLVFERQ